MDTPRIVYSRASRRFAQYTVAAAVSLGLFVAGAAADTTLFSETFTRSNSNTVGNSWTETEGSSSEAAINSNTLLFTPNDSSNLPIVKHTFTAATSTHLTWQFTFNWVRSGGEENYEVWMQLGNSATMVSPGTSDSTGVAINLKWGSPSMGMTMHKGFGYVTGNGATTTTIQSLTGSKTILVTANLAYRTYDIAVNGTTVASGVAFDNNVSIDAIRLYADGVSNGNFSSRSFDTITITAVSLFSDVSSSVGFNLQSTSDETYGSGLHWADLDNDGDLDCIVTGDTGRLLTSSNQGASFFASSLAGVYRQGALIDIDNDSDVDFWAGDYGSYDNETIFLNNGAGSLSDGGNLGFNSASNNEAVAAGDINGDGYCDLVMLSENGNWLITHGGASTPTLTGTVATSYGFNDAGDFGNGDYCSSGDVNGDGFVDFFYHYGGGKLFRSDGDGTYTEGTSGISVVTGGSDKFGSAWADYDNDGDLDLFCSRFASGSAGYLWSNTAGAFSNVAASAGITDTSAQRSCCWGDYDNDGDLDLYITTTSGANKLYRNNGSGSFSLVTHDDTDATGNGHDAVFVDYDNDGDLDLAVVREDTTNILYKNLLNNTRYLKVRAIGAGKNATNVACIGTRVELYDSTGTTLLQRRDIGVARGFGGTQPLWVHFGGVTAGTNYTVRVYFKSGIVNQSVTPASASTVIGSTTINQMVTITEPDPVTALQVIRWIETDPHN